MTIRHLLTHTHGLKIADGKLVSEYKPGESWAYVALLVIPEENVVAVRMFNRYGSSDGYDYLNDIRSFGDTVYKCSIKESTRQ